MIDFEDLFLKLRSLEIPVAYDHFDSNKNITPPFIVYRTAIPDVFNADGITYYRPYNYEIELITEKKDITLEKQIEDLLTTNNIPYEVAAEVWDNDEKIYHNFFEI